MSALLMTKLIVGNLERAIEFYAAVFGLAEGQRVVGTAHGRAFTELVMVSSAQEGGKLVLFTYDDQDTAPVDEATLVFAADDIEGVLHAALARGAQLLDEPRFLEEHQLTFALFRDPEGHLVELVHRHG